MRADILSVCILATTILGNTRHVIGFLTSQATRTAATSPQESQQRLPSLPLFMGGIAHQPGRHSPSPAAQPNAQERAVYDPGDELLHALNAEQQLGLMPEEPDYADTVYNELEVASKFDMLKKLEEDLRAEQELVDKSALLMKMLEDPTLDTLPLVYVEEEDPDAVAQSPSGDDYAELENAVQDLVLGQSKSKRSRYYRRYPWKRHNKNRGNYEPELRYACTPSKEDIFKLLMNLHENRKGNHSKTVNFCNRKRPAKAVFTNIRFLG